AKGPWFINRDEMGVHVNIADFKGTTATINAWKALQLVDKDFNSVTNEGYLKRFGNPVKDGKGWDDKYYLFPIPLNELALDPQLVQNPGW
ncbi:MAG: RagB/SusD family nutrient uptake outer membrane protein, partial [Candidatus Azobacteroides sp.]|nr:RagB/SusD family nutrient uptake outer membrane protein [Candidatus Azobacteroides sp.]